MCSSDRWSPGQEALLAAAEHQPDLMLMDVDLKGEMDGIAAAVEIYNRLGIRCVFLAEHVDATMRTRATEAGPVAILDKTSPMSVIADALRSAPSRNTIIGHDPGGQAMRTVLIATAASISCFLVTGALAQTVNTQATTAASSAANAGAPPGQQQVTLPSVVTTIRRAGMGPGGFTQLCDDPLDPRVFTEECAATGIGR